MSDTTPIGAFQDARRDYSMGRIIAFMSACLGAVVILSALVLMFASFFMGKPLIVESTEVMGVGTALIGGAVGMKGWQTKLENQQAPSTTAGN